MTDSNPTTDQLPDFNPGDRVRHLGRAENGVVASVTAAGVEVLFDSGESRGLFDVLWFHVHPHLLQRLP